jgi:anti-sigma-K factor RskA
MRLGTLLRWQWWRWSVIAGCVAATAALLLAAVPASASAAHPSRHGFVVLRSSHPPKHQTLSKRSFGELDCNGL